MAINYAALDPTRINTYSIGFDRMFDSLTSASGYTQQTNYPPYNIIKKSDTEFLIEVAIAGFSKDDVEVRMAENRLNISSIDLQTQKLIVQNIYIKVFLLVHLNVHSRCLMMLL